MVIEKGSQRIDYHRKFCRVPPGRNKRERPLTMWIQGIQIVIRRRNIEVNIWTDKTEKKIKFHVQSWDTGKYKRYYFVKSDNSNNS